MKFSGLLINAIRPTLIETTWMEDNEIAVRVAGATIEATLITQIGLEESRSHIEFHATEEETRALYGLLKRISERVRGSDQPC